MKEVVCFFIKGREFGVDVSQMKTLANDVTIQPRDNLPDFIKGIVDVHGEQVPMIDIDKLLSIPDRGSSSTEKKNVVLISSYGVFAIESDGVSEIVHVEDSKVQGVPGFFSNDKTNYADCFIQKDNNALVLVINPDKLLSEEQIDKYKKVEEELEKERIEAERKRQEEIRKRKEEEKRLREEEIARMQAGGVNAPSKEAKDE